MILYLVTKRMKSRIQLKEKDVGMLLIDVQGSYM